MHDGRPSASDSRLGGLDLIRELIGLVDDGRVFAFLNEVGP